MDWDGIVIRGEEGNNTDHLNWILNLSSVSQDPCKLYFFCGFEIPITWLCGFAFAPVGGNKHTESRWEPSGQITEIYSFQNVIVSFLWQICFVMSLTSDTKITDSLLVHKPA